MSVENLREVAVPGEVPRLEIPDWREKYGVVAGITVRGTGPGRGFDLGLWSAEPVGEVMGRWHAFRAAERGFECVVLGNQVHRTEVAWHERGQGWEILAGIDGHATEAEGTLLTVTVADCIPVYLLDPDDGAVALLHAGWRGTAGGILAQGLERLLERETPDIDKLVMHCGVGICGECYEVGREVMEGCGLPWAGAGPWHVDLREVLAEQGRKLGIRNVTVSEWCSAHDRPLFYSHRASGGADGRMVAYLGRPLGGNR
jgi:YfiH family protein